VKRIVGVVVAVVVLLVGSVFFWSSSAAAARRAKVYQTHRVDFAVPRALTEAEAAELPRDPPPDLAAVALERAKARGKHLVEARYACGACHGADFGGGTMIDAPPMGQLFGMNLTRGKGSVVAEYQASDWDRAVRHGVHRDGTPTVMPSSDYFQMSDEELGDVISYLTSLPPVDREKPRPVFGPVGTMLVATGKFDLPAEGVDHQKAHAASPPSAEAGLKFGAHLAQICTGCHGTDLAGGPIASGDPSWPPAANLTPLALKDWTEQDFVSALQQGTSKDGRPLREPMTVMISPSKKMTPSELSSLWAYVKQVPAKPSRK
jgi:mono/diheme cytochrome c family protein